MNKLTMMMLSVALTAGIPVVNADMRDDSPKHLVVHFADLDLTGPHGVAVLYRRLESAARRVCSPLEGKDPARIAAFKLCIADTLSNAVTQVDRPTLDAYYRATLKGRNAMPSQTTARK
jgi:UrcA family protein